MATKEEIEKLLKGRRIVEIYLARKTIRRSARWTHPSISDFRKSLGDLGFKTIDDFLAYDRRLSMLEISKCYKVVNRFTGEEPAICDGCKGRKVKIDTPDCMRSSRTMEIESSKTACVATRLTNGKTWTPTAISLEEDSIYQAQDAKHKEIGHSYGIKFSIMDALDWWSHPDHTPPSCCAKVIEAEEPDFDPNWRIGK